MTIGIIVAMDKEGNKSALATNGNYSVYKIIFLLTGSEEDVTCLASLRLQRLYLRIEFLEIDCHYFLFKCVPQ